MNFLPQLFSETGGLAYHSSAFRYRATLWQPFVSSVEAWLGDWRPSTRELIIFGSSAGWTLPKTFVSRFESVLCVEPDPLARWLFAKRFMSVRRLEFETRTDLLPWFRQGEWAPFLDRHSSAALLFSNFLGQLPLLIPPAMRTPALAAQTQTEFLSGLHGREWASYHDVLSARAPLRVGAPLRNDGQFELAELASCYFDSSRTDTVLDHETSWLEASKFSVWNLRPGIHHIVGFTSRAVHAGTPPNTVIR